MPVLCGLKGLVRGSGIILLLSLITLKCCFWGALGQDFRCNCTECVPAVLQSIAGSVTCEERIDAVLNADPSLTEEQACSIVSDRYPAQQCGPFCHPVKCDGRAPDHCDCDDCTTDVWNSVVFGSLTYVLFCFIRIVRCSCLGCI